MFADRLHVDAARKSELKKASCCKAQEKLYDLAVVTVRSAPRRGAGDF